jgi:16S rRNA processing protein RimM
VPEQQKTEWATIGQVVALFGVRGELKVRLLTDIPGRFQQLEAVYASTDHQRLVVERARPHKGEMIVVKFVGIDDANTAEPLCRQALLIPESQLAHLPSDSYYQHDILGLQVITLAGRNLGRIVEILETGSNDVYIIKGSDEKQVMIPAIKSVVKQIDLVGHTMYVDPLPGLLEPAGREDEETSETEESMGFEDDLLVSGNSTQQQE